MSVKVVYHELACFLLHSINIHIATFNTSSVTDGAAFQESMTLSLRSMRDILLASKLWHYNIYRKICYFCVKSIKYSYPTCHVYTLQVWISYNFLNHWTASLAEHFVLEPHPQTLINASSSWACETRGTSWKSSLLMSVAPSNIIIIIIITSHVNCLPIYQKKYFCLNPEVFSLTNEREAKRRNVREPLSAQFGPLDVPIQSCAQRFSSSQTSVRRRAKREGTSGCTVRSFERADPIMRPEVRLSHACSWATEPLGSMPGAKRCFHSRSCGLPPRLGTWAICCLQFWAWIRHMQFCDFRVRDLWGVPDHVILSHNLNIFLKETSPHGPIWCLYGSVNHYRHLDSLNYASFHFRDPC